MRKLIEIENDRLAREAQEQATDVTRMSFMRVTDPNLLTVDFEHLGLVHKETVLAREKANPSKPEPTEQELRRLRNELFGLKQNAHHFETRANDSAGNVKLLQQRLDDALVEKKRASTAGNLRGERSAESQVKSLEIDLREEENKFKGLAHQLKLATAALKDWPHYTRLKELEKACV